MIDNRLRDNNNDTVISYHQNHFSHFTGFPQYHNTNIDKVCQFLDQNTFQSFLDFQEQDRAYDIDYAHGLELDDKFGDPYGIPRNNLDDEAYRFILKCHILAITCNGSLPNLVHFVASVLGCNENDVTLGMARHYVNNHYVGEPDTILIRNININNVANDHLVPLLSDQLQLAVAADKRVDDVNFYTNINPANVYVGTNVVMSAGIQINIPSTINNESRFEIKNDVSANIVSGGKIQVNIPQYDNNIHISNDRSINVTIGEHLDV